MFVLQDQTTLVTSLSCPLTYDQYIGGSDMRCIVCEEVHIKYPLLVMGKHSRFPLWLQLLDILELMINK